MAPHNICGFHVGYVRCPTFCWYHCFIAKCLGQKSLVDEACVLCDERYNECWIWIMQISVTKVAQILVVTDLEASWAIAQYWLLMVNVYHCRHVLHQIQFLDPVESLAIEECSLHEQPVPFHVEWAALPEIGNSLSSCCCGHSLI